MKKWIALMIALSMLSGCIFFPFEEGRGGGGGHGGYERGDGGGHGEGGGGHSRRD